MSEPDISPVHITIALCTFNGALHLRAQLDSYLAQDHTNWSLWVSDDGSSDGTRDILDEFSHTHGATYTVRIIDGPQQGVTANFLTLLCHPEFPAGFTALSDQDDIWKPEKLAQAITRMTPHTGLCLYGAQSIHVNNALAPIGVSSTRGAVPDFTNALVQNIISGHSAVLSSDTLQLVRLAGVQRWVPYQDWWLYLLVTGAGGHVIIDNCATLLYRQHDTNLMGAHSGWRATWGRATQVLGRTYCNWLNSNTAALQKCADLLTPDARHILDQFTRRPRHVWTLKRLGIHRQGRFGTICVYLAAALGRI